jgi:hypothetical protein
MKFNYWRNQMGAHAERLKLYKYGINEDVIRDFNRGWARKLVDILQEQIDRLSVSDTRRLRNSIDYAVHGTDTLEHRFLMYGIYVAAGVGKGFEHGNLGFLPFMGGVTREEYGYGIKQVGAGLSERAMREPKFEHITVKHGKNAGKKAALTRGKRMKSDWFMRKYYYQLQRLNEKQAVMYGEAYQGLVSSFLEGLFSALDAKNRIRSNRF